MTARPRPPAPCAPALSMSYLTAASRSSTRTPESRGPSIWIRLPPWCLERTSMALRRLSTAWTRSFSSPRNSDAVFSRIAVACFRASVSSAICCFISAISVDVLPNLALRLSISEESSTSLASASAMARVFSFSLVSHQQTILSYMADSFSDSARSSACILPRSATTRLTGLASALSESPCRARTEAAAPRPPRAASAPARMLTSTAERHKRRAIPLSNAKGPYTELRWPLPER
mmetsp:Transcript_1474/g.5004  ORF Transcript_1474/g.5004 Transcript_1474/m.5004 type:complete len:234 (-) Transcript_1474:12-713(-)